jgi:hypothetical protein
MEERAKKAREIVERIKILKSQISDIKRARVMDLYTPVKTIRLDLQTNERSDDNYKTRVIAHIYNTFIDVTLAEISHLEKKLAEI